MNDKGEVVTKNAFTNDNVYFMVKINQIFKGRDKLDEVTKSENGLTIRLYTGGNGAMCGLPYMNIGSDWLLTGRVTSRNQVWANHCNVFGLWEYVDAETMTLLTNESKKADLLLSDPNSKNSGICIQSHAFLLFISAFALVMCM